MNGDILAVSWLDNKGVHFLSTIHDAEHTQDTPEEEKVVKRKGKIGAPGPVDVPCTMCSAIQ